MERLLVDTDVILDFYFEREPFAEHTAKVFSLMDKGKIKGYVTPVIVANVYYMLRKNNSHSKVIQSLSYLFHFIEVLTMDKNTIISALNSGFKDFEDALQNYAAENSQFITGIITRNTKDYKSSQLAVMTPHDYLKSL